jgi:hypothetical protein
MKAKRQVPHVLYPYRDSDAEERNEIKCTISSPYAKELNIGTRAQSFLECVTLLPTELVRPYRMEPASDYRWGWCRF